MVRGRDVKEPGPSRMDRTKYLRFEESNKTKTVCTKTQEPTTNWNNTNTEP